MTNGAYIATHNGRLPDMSDGVQRWRAGLSLEGRPRARLIGGDGDRRVVRARPTGQDLDRQPCGQAYIAPSPSWALVVVW